MLKKLLLAFPAFKHRDYRYYFWGQFVSLIGTWLQMIAQSWLVLQLTHSAFMVGLISALGFLPVLIFGLLGGALVDRFNTRYVLIFTQISSMILALALGFLALSGLVTVWMIGVLAFLLGIIQSLDAPARQSFTIEIVGKEDLSSAIALNMGMFNSARVIGPALAGLLIATFGNAGAFLLNGLSFIAPITALFLMTVNSPPHPGAHEHPIQAIKSGIKYAYTHPVIKNLLIFCAITSIFGFSYSTLLPVIIEKTFHKGASELGILFSAAGTGALTGVMLVQLLMKKFKKENIIVSGSLLFVLFIFSFTYVTNFYLALVILYFASFSLTMQMALTNSTIQHAVENAYRGRVMSLFTLSFMGMFPIGSLQIGFVAEHFGSENAIRLGAVVVFFGALYLYYSLSKLKHHS